MAIITVRRHATQQPSLMRQPLPLHCYYCPTRDDRKCCTRLATTNTLFAVNTPSTWRCIRRGRGLCTWEPIEVYIQQRKTCCMLYALIVILIVLYLYCICICVSLPLLPPYAHAHTHARTRTSLFSHAE